MSSPFRAAVETGDVSAAVAELAEDVEFRSPAVFKPYHGKVDTAVVLGAVFSVLRDFRYTAEIRDGDREVLVFEARVGDRSIQGADFIRYDASGRVAELTVMMRPLSGLNAVVEAVGAQLNSLQPPR